MRYTAIQREEYGAFITIGEYVYETDRQTFERLCQLYPGIKSAVGRPVKPFTVRLASTEAITTAMLERLMTERPMPGRGGLLPWEGEDALYD